MNIQIKNLNKRFGDEWVLQGIDLDFPMGSRLALVGANGSGKSTLLRAVMGMIGYEGKVVFTDSSRAALSSLQIKEKIAYVPQITPYFSSLVSDVVKTLLDLRGIELDDLIQCLDRFDLNYRTIASFPFRKLSGGMKQKLLIALALVSRPSVLLLDEPTASLDPVSRESFYQMAKNLSRSSFILCSHRLEEMQQLVDEVIVLDKGVIVFTGKIRDYLKKVLKKI